MKNTQNHYNLTLTPITSLDEMDNNENVVIVRVHDDQSLMLASTTKGAIVRGESWLDQTSYCLFQAVSAEEVQAIPTVQPVYRVECKIVKLDNTDERMNEIVECEWADSEHEQVPFYDLIAATHKSKNILIS